MKKVILFCVVILCCYFVSGSGVSFSDDFMFGVATASYQGEGGNFNSDWHDWELKGKIVNNESAGNATNDFIELEKNIKILNDLNVQAFRFSLEWSRIEVEEGVFDESAIAYYKDLVRELKQNDIEPFVTLFHFSSPKWFAAKGGFSKEENLIYFKRFVEKVVPKMESVGVKYWTTLNEPAVYASLAYGSGIFPPGEKNFFKSLDVFYNLIEAHHICYDIIKENSKDSMVGVAKHFRDYEFGFVGFFREIILNNWFLGLTQDCDFIGVNFYYTCTFYDRCYVNPEGIYNVLKHLKKYDKPIYITENGVPTKNEIERQDYITGHLKYIAKSIDEGLDIRSYFFWTLFDNFEWERGWDPSFGLMTTDKKPKESYYLYQEICNTKKVK